MRLFAKRRRRAVPVPARGQGPRSLGQILSEAIARMDEEDAELLRARDPLAYAGLPRRRLSDQLFRRRR